MGTLLSRARLRGFIGFAGREIMALAALSVLPKHAPLHSVGVTEFPRTFFNPAASKFLPYDWSRTTESGPDRSMQDGARFPIRSVLLSIRISSFVAITGSKSRFSTAVRMPARMACSDAPQARRPVFCEPGETRSTFASSSLTTNNFCPLGRTRQPTLRFALIVNLVWDVISTTDHNLYELWKQKLSE